MVELVEAALREHPDAEIIVKTHPDVASGRKAGGREQVLEHARVRLITAAANPIAMLQQVDEVYVMTSLLGFEALLLDLPVTCFGAPFYSGGSGGSSPGVVLVYRHGSNNRSPGDDWVFHQFITAPAPASGDGFGTFVSFAGNQLLVSSPFATASGITQRGTVYAYQVVANSFTLQQTINPGVALSTSDWFGFHTSADQGWLAVGVPFAATQDAGQVQLFRFDTGTSQWIFHSQISGTVASARHGIRVLLRGDRLLLGATEETASGGRGWVYEYQRSGAGAAATWTQSQRFRLTGGQTSVFGSALALSPSGRTLLVGAPFEATPDLQGQMGTAIAFERDGSGQWAQTARLDPPVIADAENFGASVAFSGESDVLIGDIREGANVLGATHLYHRNATSTWSKTFSWQRGTGNALDFMGGAVLGVVDQAIVSGPGVDNGGSTDEGRVFVFNNTLPLFRDGLE